MYLLDAFRIKLGAYLWRCINAVQSSGFVHCLFRSQMLRALGCEIHKQAIILENVYIGSKNIYLAKDVAINVGCFIDACARTEFHEGVRVGPYVKILTGSHDYENSVMRRDPWAPVKRLPVTIERGCWIGIGAIILPGVKVREGCVIGAGAVVVKSTEPNGLYAGNPARRIKNLPIN